MSRTFFPLNERLPGTSSHELLGCIVVDPLNPFNIYTPKETPPSTILQHERVDTTLEKDIYTVIDTSYGTKFIAKLERLLRIERDGSTLTSRIINAPFVRTTRLRSHDDIFQRLSAHKEVRGHLGKVLERGGGQAYMVVGVKTCFDGSFVTMVDRTFSITAEATLPVQEFAGALKTLGYLGQITDPKVSLESWNQMRSASAAKGVGEEVFAVEYRLIRKRLVRPPAMRDLVVPQEGMFSEKGDQEHPKPTVVNVGGDDYELAENVLAGLPPQDTLLFAGDD
ncbi:hypothetical protein FOYG_17486 [Fusarium oxysporum NRRL 32931]|uniref:Uncharacterized protein n=1 Tax=Fusarium oxysporum NRRL 32931 TaxID=660029 RepID=W9HGP0_FUSOX|nr:hypothetical protein FOYG_17486 [Fusarium oxysporum NRRL 32931]